MFILSRSYLLQLYYLDECPLEDTKSLMYFHILPEAKIKVRVWKTNKNLVIASRNGTWKGTFSSFILRRTVYSFLSST